MLQKEIIILPGIEEMSEYLARLIGKKTAAACDVKPLNIALSGGSTPKLIFENLVIRHKEKVKWDRIRFFQVDERCVPPDSPESNFNMIRHHLLDGLNFPEYHFFRIRGENDPQREAIRYGKIMVENLPMAGKWPVFDLVLLGLGEDGHTASLFPGNTHVLNSKNCCEVAFQPLTEQKRITLTLPVLNGASQLVFMVTGQEKAEIVAEIIQIPDKNHLPASLVNPGKGALTWLLDTDAASKMRPGVKE
jgi:6-phosphogluconolactonase